MYSENLEFLCEVFLLPVVENGDINRLEDMCGDLLNQTLLSDYDNENYNYLKQ